MRSPTLKYFLEKRHVDHGGAMVEFAIVLPLLLIISFGIIEFGILFYDKAVLVNATREGARAGIVVATYNDKSTPNDPTDDEYTYDFQTANIVKDIVEKYCENNLISFDLDSKVDVSSPIWIDLDGNGRTTPGDELHVSVQYDYSYLVFSNILSLLGKSLTIKAETVMLLF